MRDGNTALGDFTPRYIEHGGLGWECGIVADKLDTPAELMLWGDVSPPMYRAIGATKWQPLIVQGKVPAGLINAGGGSTIGTPGSRQGGYAGTYAGGTKRKYIAIQDRVIYNPANDDVFVDTGITGMPVGSNNRNPRSFAQKCQGDPANQGVAYFMLGQHGLHYLLDGTTKVSPTWLPKPTSPSFGGGTYPVSVDIDFSWGLVEIDLASALTASGPGQRHSRIAFHSSGSGVWVSTDGGVSGTDITGTGPIYVSCLRWINNILWVVGSTSDGEDYQQNLYKWTGTGTLVRVNTGLNGGFDYSWRFIVADSRYTGGFFLTTSVVAYYCHTQDGTTFESVVNNPSLFWTHMKVRPQGTPQITEKFRGKFQSASTPQLIGGRIYHPSGVGLLSIALADYPATWDGTFAGLPLWDAESRNRGMLVGQQTLWLRDQLLCGSQDLPIVRDEDGRRGHKATVRHYPLAISNLQGMSKGLVPGFAVARWSKTPPNCFAYTLDGGDSWRAPATQPSQSSSELYSAGHAVAGPGHVALSFPTRIGGRAQMTADVRDTAANPWTNLRFWKGATELDMTDGGLTARENRGLQGYGDSVQVHLACVDPTTGDLWAVLIGASDNQAPGPTSWENDPLGHAGLYRMQAGDYPNFRQQSAGHPANVGNRGFFGAKLIADGNGHLVFINTYLPQFPLSQDNPAKVYTIATNSWASIASPRHVVSAAFGSPWPGDTQPYLWLLGWGASASGLGDFGIFGSRDVGATVHLGPKTAGGRLLEYGYVNDIEAQTDEAGFKGRWGMLGASIKSAGHVALTFELAA